jgi:hypothetical protein
MSWNVQLQKICQKTITQTASHPSSWRFALRHWFRESDWLPILEVTLALDEESTGRVGDDTVGGPSVSRYLWLIHKVTRDILLGVLPVLLFCFLICFILQLHFKPHDMKLSLEL